MMNVEDIVYRIIEISKDDTFSESFKGDSIKLIITGFVDDIVKLKNNIDSTSLNDYDSRRRHAGMALDAGVTSLLSLWKPKDNGKK